LYKNLSGWIEKTAVVLSLLLFFEKRRRDSCMGEILIECSVCEMEMKYSLLKIHICPGRKMVGLEELFELIDNMINEN
jgi:hypothetical protein